MSRPHFHLGLMTRHAVFVGVLVILFLTVAEPMKQAVKRWRVERHLAQTRAASAAGAWHAAGKALTSALILLPNDPQVLRELAGFLDRTQSDPHLLIQTLRTLAESGHSETDDALMHLRGLMSERRFKEARQALERTPAVLRQRPDGMLIEASLLKEEGDSVKAAEMVRRSHALRSDDPASVLALAIEESWNTPHEVQSAAVKRLWAFAEKGNLPAALGAIRHLAVYPQVTLPQLERLLQLAEAHPLCEPATRLPVISAIMRKAPESRAAMLDAEMARYRGGSNRDLIELALWLGSEAENDRVLDVCPFDVAIMSQELFPIVLLALAQRERWKDLRALLTRGNVPASGERISVWLAWADGFLEPDLKNARQELASGISKARQTASVEDMATALQVAEIHGLWDLAFECCTVIAQMDVGQEVPMLEKAWEIARQQGDEHGMLTVMSKLHELRPSSVLFDQRVFYMHLLLGMDIEKTAHLIASDFKGSSSSMRALLAALAAHRMKDMQAVKRELSGVKELTDMKPGERAVYAGLLALAGETSAGFQVAEKVPAVKLLTEEQSFLKLAQ